jgi:hypothetical protein
LRLAAELHDVNKTPDLIPAFLELLLQSGSIMMKEVIPKKKKKPPPEIVH